MTPKKGGLHLSTPNSTRCAPPRKATALFSWRMQQLGSSGAKLLSFRVSEDRFILSVKSGIEVIGLLLYTMGDGSVLLG